jgi:hypothetical protein
MDATIARRHSAAMANIIDLLPLAAALLIGIPAFGSRRPTRDSAARHLCLPSRARRQEQASRSRRC